MTVLSQSKFNHNILFSGLDGTVVYDDFKRLLSKNQRILQEFVLQNYNLDTIEEWANQKAKKTKKSAKKSRGKNKFESWKFSVKETKYGMLEEMGRHTGREEMNKAQVMHELGDTVLAAVDADSFNIYLVENDGFLTSYCPGINNRLSSNRTSSNIHLKDFQGTFSNQRRFHHCSILCLQQVCRQS